MKHVIPATWIAEFDVGAFQLIFTEFGDPLELGRIMAVINETTRQDMYIAGDPLLSGTFESSRLTFSNTSIFTGMSGSDKITVIYDFLGPMTQAGSSSFVLATDHPTISVVSAGGTVNIGNTVPVSIAGTVAISASTLPLPTGAATETTLSAMNTKVPVIGVTPITTASAGALNADLIAAVDVSAYQMISVQVIGTFVGTLTFQGSNDNVTFSSVAALPTSATSSAVVNTTTTIGLFQVPVLFKYFRVRMTAYTSGTATSSAFGHRYSPPLQTKSILATSTQSGTWTMQPGNTANTTPWLNTPTPLATQGMSTSHHLISAATTNATSVKGTAGNIGCLVLTNVSASIKFFKLYNKASAPTVGTDTPIMTIGIPPSSTMSVDTGYAGIRMSTGIAYAITGAIPITDSTAVALSDVSVSMMYI